MAKLSCEQLLDEAREAEQAGKTKAAIKHYSKYVSETGGSPDLFVAIGRLHEKVKDDLRACDAYKQANL